MEITLKKTDKGFYYGYVGSERHGRPSFKFWVNRMLVKYVNSGKPLIEFPLANAEIMQTKKSSILVKPSSHKNIFLVGRHCGYRGSSWFEIIEPKEAPVFKFQIWDSEQGSLGISVYGLVVASDYVKVKEEADGELYGDDPVYYRKYKFASGEFTIEDSAPCHEDEELCELLKEEEE